MKLKFEAVFRIFIAVIVLLIVRGCGSSGFYDMGTLADHFTTQYNSQPGETISDVKCHKTGDQTAYCSGKLSDGEFHGQDVEISKSGDEFTSYEGGKHA